MFHLCGPLLFVWLESKDKLGAPGLQMVFPMKGFVPPTDLFTDPLEEVF